MDEIMYMTHFYIILLKKKTRKAGKQTDDNIYLWRKMEFLSCIVHNFGFFFQLQNAHFYFILAKK
jgi:hypothetical protein